jgi:hypothetical protein
MCSHHVKSNREEDHQAEKKWSKAEEDIKSKEIQDERRSELEEEMHPSRRPIHKFFVLISAVTAIAAFCMLIGQFVGLQIQKSGPVQYVIRLYVIALCVLAVLVELGWPKFARETLHNWTFRGLCYSFIGVLGLEENDTLTSKNAEGKGFGISKTYIQVVAWIMVGCGVLYILMGLLCLHILYNRVRADYEERLERAPAIRRAAQTYGSAGDNPV